MIKSHVYPIIGSWYQDVEHKDIFEVVAIDSPTKMIEIQYFNGDIEEYDPDDWYSIDLKLIPPPQDWSGPFEVDKEDYPELDDEPLHPHPPSTDDIEQ